MYWYIVQKVIKRHRHIYKAICNLRIISYCNLSVIYLSISCLCCILYRVVLDFVEPRLLLLRNIPYTLNLWNSLIWYFWIVNLIANINIRVLEHLQPFHIILFNSDSKVVHYIILSPVLKMRNLEYKRHVIGLGSEAKF